MTVLGFIQGNDSFQRDNGDIAISTQPREESEVSTDPKLRAHALKRVAAGVDLPTPRLFEPAKHTDER